jgi:hypothetical protein
VRRLERSIVSELLELRDGNGPVLDTVDFTIKVGRHASLLGRKSKPPREPLELLDSRYVSIQGAERKGNAREDLLHC